MDKKYYVDLIGRIYKILPLYEENKDNFKIYVEGVYIEMCGNDDFSEVKQIRNKIKGLGVANVGHDAVRRTVFECINIIDKIITMIEVEM